MNRFRRLIEFKLDRTAWVKSLFTNKPVHRKYDEWYYRRGKLISSFDLFLEIHKDFITCSNPQWLKDDLKSIGETHCAECGKPL